MICQIKMIEPRFKLIMERCGNFIPFNLKYTEIIFMLTFVSDHMDNARGFNISWTGRYDFQHQEKIHVHLVLILISFVQYIMRSIDAFLKYTFLTQLYELQQNQRKQQQK